MKYILLTQGQVAIVDDADYHWLNQFKWYASKVRKTGKYYAVSMEPKQNGKRKARRMHCLIMDAKGVDHRDGDGLNNQRTNLRVCSQKDNVRNADKSSRTLTSVFKGVSLRKESGKFRAQITVNREKRMLGTFDTAMDAAKAYDSAALEHFGEFARLNFAI